VERTDQPGKPALRRISVAVVETNIADPAICRDVYDRLAYGGTPHEPNAVYA
jgi:hypothetical protein